MTLPQATLYGALIAAGAAVVGFVVALAGNLVIERRRDRRMAERQRDRAIAELLAAVVDLVTGIQAVRAAYQGQSGWRDTTRRAATLLAAFGAEYGSPKGLPLVELLDWRRLGRFLSSLLDALNRMDDKQRLVATDLATILLPRTNRFYSAVAVLTLGPDKQIAGAVRKMTPAVGALMEVISAKPGKYERARRRAERALADFRSTADARQKGKSWQQARESGRRGSRAM